MKYERDQHLFIEQNRASSLKPVWKRIPVRFKRILKCLKIRGMRCFQRVVLVLAFTLWFTIICIKRFQDSFTDTANFEKLEDCQSEVYVYNPITIITLVNSSPNYIEGAVKLAKTIHRHTTINVDLIAFEVRQNRIPNQYRSDITHAGWQICTVERLAARGEPRESRFMDTYTKLRIFNLIHYKTAIFLDSDTIVVGNLDQLLMFELPEPYLIAAVRAPEWWYGFNTGVFLIHPKTDEFTKISDKLENLEGHQELSDQTLLNQVYTRDNGKWFYLQAGYNMLTKQYMADHDWENWLPNMYVVHFAG
eukprot:985668_1